MRCYRKEIAMEAFQLPPGSAFDLDDFHAWAVSQNWGGYIVWPARKEVIIETMAGVCEARPLDWIVKGPHGEFFVVSHGVFHEDYRLSEEAEGEGGDKNQAL